MPTRYPTVHEQPRTASRLAPDPKAMRAYAKQSKDFEMANWAAEIRIRAERRMGEMIRAQKETGGMNKGGGDRKSEQYHQSHDETGDSQPKLSDMGITKSMSSRAQAIASVPEDEFEETITKHREQQKELTGAHVGELGRGIYRRFHRATACAVALSSKLSGSPSIHQSSFFLRLQHFTQLSFCADSDFSQATTAYSAIVVLVFTGVAQADVKPFPLAIKHLLDDNSLLG
ncbi:hypothetical protein MNBD_GAMMA25-180 [hydrothermal vent metagenome]|uniref:Uncharacterized protein n=1 Tax=hydrothermal vent metagenome TaxID=652676 RepID=A0A3B1BBN7_9ZZZZ